MGTQLKEQSLALWGAVNQRGILLPAIFVFLWQATPTADTAMFYLQTNKLGFKPEFLGQVRLVGSIASLAGPPRGLEYFRTLFLHSAWVL